MLNVKVCEQKYIYFVFGEIIICMPITLNLVFWQRFVDR